MPTIREKPPEKLRPFVFHGVDLDWSGGDKNAVGDCPWCGRENKFNVKIETGEWRCLVCGEGTTKGGGNIYTFIRKLWELSRSSSMIDTYQTRQYERLAQDRGLKSTETLKQWGVVQSMLTGDWLIPGHGIDGKLNQLYRYVNRIVLPTPTLSHQLFGMDTYDPSKEIVFVCEGPWDGMALWESFDQCAWDERGGDIVDTYDPGKALLLRRSLRQNRNVLAVPGCNTFNPKWAPLFEGIEVVLPYDNDHPREHPKTGKSIAPAGISGVKRVSGILSQSSSPPAVIQYLKWGEDGFDPELDSGTDVRDMLGMSNDTCMGVKSILSRICRVPAEWLLEHQKDSQSAGLSCVNCDNYRSLVTAWRKALRWTDGLDCALSVMLASVTSTKSVGDQLWIKVIGPASCGKSTLCEAISVNTEHVLAKSTIRGFHSGFKTDKDGDEDHSLVSQLTGKTLVTKDGDTLLQSPNLSQILSEARDIYDSTSRTHYRNSTSRDYLGVRMTWLLCGTSSLRSIDSSELGERFLDCVIMDGIDDELEDEILWRVANRAERNVAIEADGMAETQYEPEMAKVMQLTGGYVSHLRSNATRLLSKVVAPEWVLRKCAKLGKFVAYMRARPSKQQDEDAEREFAARLVSQHIRLAKCLAVVLNRSEIDAEVMRRVTKVALDTSRGQTLEIAKYLWESSNGLELRSLALHTNKPEDKTRSMLRFLRQIGAVKTVSRVKNGVRSKPVWVLSDRVKELYGKVVAVK